MGISVGKKVFRAIGLMSGTSMDGIDAALIETDGLDMARRLGDSIYPYSGGFRGRLRSCMGKRGGAEDFDVAVVERELTNLHAAAVNCFLEELGLDAAEIDIIGFHGHTIRHNPEEGVTVQIGDGDHLARATGIPVVNDFRSADVRAGGQGAPLVPVYHRALACGLDRPVAIVNIGGVANVTYLESGEEDGIIAFDTGPGNAMLDDWMSERAGMECDMDGKLAATGRVDEALLLRFMQSPYFAKNPPKSLDRNFFHEFMPEALCAADGAATLTMMTAASIAAGFRHFPRRPSAVYLTGGGRKNVTLRRWLGGILEMPVVPVEDIGWNGDSLEAEAFAYLAVRSLLGLPITYPSTTGAVRPMTGGVYHDVTGSALRQGRIP